MATVKRMSRSAKIAAFILIGAALVTLLVLAGARVYLTPERTRAAIEHQASEAIAGEVEVRGFDWLLYPRSGVVEDLTIRDEQGREVLILDRAVLSFDPSGILTRTIRLSNVEIDGLLVRLIATEDESFSLIEALSSPETDSDEISAGWDVIIDRAALFNGRLEVETPAGIMVIEGIALEDLSLRWEAGVLTVEAGALADELSIPELDLVARNIVARGLSIAVLEEATGAFGTVDMLTTRMIELKGVSARLVRASGSYSDGIAQVEDAVLDLFPGTLRLEGTVDSLGPETSIEARIGLEGIVPARLAHPWVEEDLLPRRVDGEVALAIRGVDDPRGTISATLNLTGPPARLTEALAPFAEETIPEAATLMVDAILVGGGARIERLLLDAGDISLFARGLIPFNEQPLSLSFEIEHARPNTILGAVNAPFSGRRASLAGQMNGSLPIPDVKAFLRVEGISGDLFDDARLDVPMRLEAGTLHVDRARLDSAIGTAHATGELRFLDEEGELLDDPALMGTILARRVDVGAIIPTGEGSAEARVRVSGTLSRPWASGSLTVDDLALAGIRFALAEAGFRADRNRLRMAIDKLEPVEGGFITGYVELDLQDGIVEAELAGSEIPARALLSPIQDPPDIVGPVRLRASVSGPTAQPTLEASLVAPMLRVKEKPLGEVEAFAQGNLDRLGFSMTIDGPAGQLTADGVLLPRAREIEEIRAGGRDILIEQLPWIDSLPVALGGFVSLNLSAEGPLTAPSIRGQIDTRALTVEGQMVHLGRLVARVGPLEDGAHAIGIGLPGALFVRARLEPGPPFIMEAAGELDGFQLSWVLPALMEAELDALLIGEATLRYQRDPAELEVSLSLPALELTVGEEALVAQRPVTMSYRNGSFLLEDLDLAGPLGRFQAGGVIGPQLSFLAFGRLEMALLAAFLPQVARSSGAVALTLQAAGTLEEPLLSGSMDLVETIRLVPRGMLREVVIDSLMAASTENRIDLFGLRGHVAGGPFLAEGSMVLDGLEPTEVDLSFRGQSLPFRAGDLTGEVDVDLRLTSIEERLLLAGTIDAVRGRYLQTLSVSGFSLAAPQPVAPAEPHGLMDRLDLALRITSLGAVDVRADAGSFSVNLVLDADLSVGGTASAPSLEGRIEAVRGVIKTPQTELPIVRGVADFVPLPGRPIRLLVDVVAEGEVLVPPIGLDQFQPRHFVSLRLEGDAEEMSLDLQSQPPLDRLEILSLLVTGQVTPSLLAPGDQRHIESAMVFAGTRLAEPLTQMVTDRLEELLNIDVLIAGVTIEGIAITAGTEVTRRLRLEGALQQGFGDTGTMALARAQYLLSNTVFLEAASRAAGGNGSRMQHGEREGRRSTIEIRARILGGG